MISVHPRTSKTSVSFYFAKSMPKSHTHKNSKLTPDHMFSVKKTDIRTTSPRQKAWQRRHTLINS